MYFWREFDPGEVSDDLARMAEIGLSPVRIFLLWEDFQPEPWRSEPKVLNRLADFARLANDHGIGLWVTLFTGHMSGANWLPGWMIEPVASPDVRFPVVTGSTSFPYRAKNPYGNPELISAQKILIREVSSVLRGHPALWGWDLGNEPSNVFYPAGHEQGRRWLGEMVGEIRKNDSRPVTLGLHQEDLEEDRGMGPADVAECCELITMHAYPAYSGWARGKTDPLFAPYLAELTRWLSGGREVWVSEFGISTGKDPTSADEESAAVYAGEVLESLRRRGFPGALWWCFGDYSEKLWGTVPFREKVHERFFGAFRNDLTPKAVVQVLNDASRKAEIYRPLPDWIDLKPDDYWKDPAQHIKRLYKKFINLSES
jgi:endo-1,4-beta-mannosidase